MFYNQSSKRVKDKKKEGFVAGMNAQGYLLVETKEGSVTLTAGEISVRMKFTFLKLLKRHKNDAKI